MKINNNKQQMSQSQEPLLHRTNEVTPYTDYYIKLWYTICYTLNKTTQNQKYEKPKT